MTIEDGSGGGKMKIEAFLNDEDMKDVNDFIKELIKKNARETDEIGTGGLTVVVENKGKDGWLFSVNRTIAYITIKKPEKRANAEVGK